MNYTPQQYRKVEQQFMQQFQVRTWEFYDRSVNSQSLIEYKKLLNQIMTRRKEMLGKKQRCEVIKRKVEEVAEGVVIIKEEECENIEELQNKDYNGDGFYLTENLGMMMNKNESRSSLQQDISKFPSSNPFQPSTSRQTSTIQSHVTQTTPPIQNQNLDLSSISDRIYTQYNVQQCLRHQQSQVQQGIFCFKRRIIQLQQQLSSQKIRSNQVQRLFIQNNNEMMHAKYTSQEVKTAYAKTRKHFNLDLEGKRMMQQKCNEKNKFQFQESVANHICLKKMKQQLMEQQRELLELEERREELEKKEKKYGSIYEKEQELVKAYEGITNINPSDFVKDKIVSILDIDDSQEQQLARKTLKELKASPNTKTTPNLSSHPSQQLSLLLSSNNTPLPQIVNQLVQKYKYMKHQLVQQAKKFKLLSSERDQKQKQYSKVVENVREVFECLEKEIIVKREDGGRAELEEMVRRGKEMMVRNRLACEKAVTVEERLRFWLGKYIGVVQNVVATFMKNDKISTKYIETIMTKLSQYTSILFTPNKPTSPQHTERQLTLDDTRNMLITCFQNWQQYFGFVDILHQSTFIHRFMSKPKLFQLFKRIIKTKVMNPRVPTEIIFEKVITLSFDEGREMQLKRVENLLEIYRRLNGYLRKVKNGEIHVYCAINYDALINNVQQPQSNEISKLPSRNELQRKSASKNLTTTAQKLLTTTNFLQRTEKSLHHLNPHLSQPHPTQQMLHSNTFSSTQKHIQPNNLTQNTMMSRLKKRKQLKSVLDIHGFYQEMREEMQKVNRMVVY